jgi:succinate dehydrogenase / fumarate reductase membrane anchor subunit
MGRTLKDSGLKLATPMSKVLGLGAAKSGVEHWWVQRLTAVALVPLGLWLALARFETLSYAAAVEWMRAPITAVLLLATVLTVVYHSYLGVQVVIEDYVHAKGGKLFTLVLSAFAHALLLLAALYSVLRVAFGAAL